MTRKAREALTTVDLILPHNEIVVKTRQRSLQSSMWVYKNGEEEEDDERVVLFMPDMGIWLDERGNRAPVFTHIYQKPEHKYTWGTELRTLNRRGYGQVGGWIKEPTHVRFYFTDPTMALLFKLTWGGQ